MPWFGKKTDIADIKRNVESATKDTLITDADLEAYIGDIRSRIKSMVKELKIIYKKYDIQFVGFKALEQGCVDLRDSIRKNKEQAYNNLISLEATITAEQKRHLALIRMAVTKSGVRVIDQIIQDPVIKEKYLKIFGSRAVVGGKEDGAYQAICSELTKLSEYVIVHKNRVYH